MMFPKFRHKVILAGLDSAGKTSIYEKVIEGTDVTELKDIPPTKGIERRRRLFGQTEIVFWDLAGQSMYRSSYIKNPKVFADTSILIFVIDIQDHLRFDESLEYFLQILMTIKNFSKPPRVFSLLHKYDPDNMGALKSRLSEASKIVSEVNKIPSLEVKKYSTSIYSNTSDLIFDKIIQEMIPGYKATPRSELADIQLSDTEMSNDPLGRGSHQSQSDDKGNLSEIATDKVEVPSVNPKQLVSEISVSTKSKNPPDLDELRLQLLSQLEKAEEISSKKNSSKLSGGYD
ncbi:MAG: hypothetical protein IH840_13600 [Candidatus Heimdallarchaeota archaeon]|nr:hypothetical protein [Candidatus Heimdallarchaeota archaeon]